MQAYTGNYSFFVAVKQKSCENVAVSFSLLVYV